MVAFVPVSAHTTNVLLVAGTDMEATESAGQVVTTKPEFDALLRQIAPDGRLTYFEAEENR